MGFDCSHGKKLEELAKQFVADVGARGDTLTVFLDGPGSMQQREVTLTIGPVVQHCEWCGYDDAPDVRDGDHVCENCSFDFDEEEKDEAEHNPDGAE